jgi:signal peptidase II
MTKLTSSLALLLVVSLLVGCDHGTKHLARRHLQGAPALELVGGVLDLRYTENRDAAFSALRSLPPSVKSPVLVGSRLAICVVVLILLARRRSYGLQRLGLAVVLAGGLGNLIDTLWRGYVVDFIHLRYWPVFNVADICVAVGVGLIFLGEHRRWRSDRSRA